MRKSGVSVKSAKSDARAYTTKLQYVCTDSTEIMNAIPRLSTGFDSPMASLTSLMATLRLFPGFAFANARRSLTYSRLGMLLMSARLYLDVCLQMHP